MEGEVEGEEKILSRRYGAIYARKKRAKRKAAGLCWDCGKAPGVPAGRVRCSACARLASERAKAWNRKQKERRMG